MKKILLSLFFFFFLSTIVFAAPFFRAFTSLTGEVTGEGAIIVVTPIDDDEIEADETVVMTIMPGSGYTVGSPSQAIIYIISDDLAIPAPVHFGGVISSGVLMNKD